MSSEETDLRRNVDAFSGLLDEIVAEQAGSSHFAVVEELRRLARERRAEFPGSEERLTVRIAALGEDEIRTAVRALSTFFDLANIAEDRQRIRVIRERERDAAPHPRGESLGAAVEHLKSIGFAPEQMQRLLDSLRIELVFTAHPTEAKRRTIRGLLRRMRDHLKETERDDLVPREREQLLEQMRSELTVFWQTDFLRPHRPDVMDEVERGLFFAEGLWKVVPRIHRDLRNALDAFYPGLRFRLPRFLRFGSWIGGDRDGNPFVTTAVTGRTLALLKRTAVERHLLCCRDLLELLVMSRRQVDASAELQSALDAAATRWPALGERLDSVSPFEISRRWLKVIEYRLEQTLISCPSLPLGEGRGEGASVAHSAGEPIENFRHPSPLPEGEGTGYQRASELEADLCLIADSLRAHHGERIAGGALQDWLDLLHTFGLHLAALDVRQDARVHVEVLAEVFRHLRLSDDYPALGEDEKQSLFAKLIDQSPELPHEPVSEQTDDAIALFRLLVREVGMRGLEVLGGHVISMTHRPSDVLAVLWLWTAAWREVHGPGSVPPSLPVVPLFETIGDLRAGAEILDTLLSNATYAEYVRRGESATQIVMVGYSDSTKDGGYLSASWGLHRAQEQLAGVAEKHGIRLVVFHGRGGALGRGGGPAARAILSLPPKSVRGALRVTEQGEVLAERYDDPQIAYRHLEQVTWATMLVSAEAERGRKPPADRSAWAEALERMSERSYRHYRSLVDDPGFLAYFEQATPITEIEQLPIGSRPARRRERKSLADLRAIPWTFAWTQSRQIIPAWFGLGTAVGEFAESRGHDWSMLQEMYGRWPLFRAIVDNAELALAKADLGIAHRYADLAGDHEAGERIWSMIAREYKLTRSVVVLITGQGELLGGTPWLRQSIQARNPYVDPLNLIQIELIRRLRARQPALQGAEDDPLRPLLRLSIQGVASGLRTTG